MKSVARTMDAANCAAVLLSVPISYHFLRLYSATGRVCRRKWRYIKYTPLPFLSLAVSWITREGLNSDRTVRRQTPSPTYR